MSNDNILALPEVQEVQAESAQLATVAASFVIRSSEQFTDATTELTRIKAAQKRLDETRKGLTRPLDESKKRIMDLFRPMADRLDEAERAIKNAVVEYQRKLEAIRREEQRKADEAARKERARLEQLRIAAEQKAREKEEALRAKAAEASAAERAKIEARLEAEAEKAAAKQAELEMRAAMVVAPVIEAEAPKAVGVSSRVNWKFRITDESKLPREYTTPDEKKIGAVVRALKGDTNIPGVTVYAEESVAARAAS